MSAEPAKDNILRIYTDGACSGNPGVGGWAAVLIYQGHEKEISGVAADTTNNRMEVTAVICALECINRPIKVIVHSDSSYVVNAFNSGWIRSWKANNWVNSAKKAVSNQDLWKRLAELVEKYDVTFVKVKGHADDYYNNRCDVLAVKEWQTYKRLHPSD